MQSKRAPIAAARVWLVLGSGSMLVAVALGALGAHALKKVFTIERMAIYETAVQYHVYHALGLLVVGLLAIQLPTSVYLRWAGLLMSFGLVVFCGSLYALSLSDSRWLGIITPVGGAAFLLAWFTLAVAIIKAEQVG